MEYAEEQKRKHHPKFLLLIIDVTDTGFDAEVSAVMGEYATHITQYVKASALVGISRVQKVVQVAIKALTGRDFYLTDTVEDAQEWLIQQ